MVADSPDENMERECCTYERMTNGDKIRSMSDEELAVLLADHERFVPCQNCDYGFYEPHERVDYICKAPEEFVCSKRYAEALIMKWLQSEVEE